MKIRISLSPYPNQKLWDKGYKVSLLFRFCGIYVTKYINDPKMRYKENVPWSVWE